jgi:heat shock protein HslJ
MHPVRCLRSYWCSLIIAVLICGCAHESAAPPPLWGTAWRLEDLGGAGVLDRAEATLEFPEPGRVAGSGSCNRFFGGVKIDADTIALSQIGSTRMACAEAVSRQEMIYFKALGSAERYTLDGSVLRIFFKDSDKPLRFIRTKP